MYADPLRKHDCAPVTDGAAALVLAAGDRANDACERPAWISGIAHSTRRAPARHPRPEGVGLRTARAARRSAAPPGSRSPSCTRRSATRSSSCASELALADDVRINPSGGALTGNPMFTGGAIRIGEAARRIWDGSASKVLGHATSGPALQQNLVCTMEGR